MIARPPPTCLLPFVLALTACGSGSNDPAPDMSGEPPAAQGPGTTPGTDTGTGDGPNPPPGLAEEPQQDTNAFATPDPAGATVLQRRGYRGATEQADRLVSTAYLNAYRGVAEELPLLAESTALGIVPVSVPCPGGGKVELSRPLADANGEGNLLRYDFDACTVPAMTLLGRLEQTRAVSTRSDRGLFSQFDDLVMEREDGTRLQLDGTSQYGETSISQPICGPVPAVVLTYDVRLGAVSIDSPEDGVTRLQDVAYIAEDRRIFEDRESCDRERRVSFTGSATATLASEPGGEVIVNLTKTGVLLRDDDEAPPTGGQATLVATGSDGGSLSVTASDDAAGLAQFDLRAGDAVVSFVDAYTFEPILDLDSDPEP